MSKKFQHNRRFAATTYARRTVLRAAMLGAGSSSGLTLLACHSSNKSRTPAQNGRSGQETPQQGGTLHILGYTNAGILDPQKSASSANVLGTASAVYSRLFRYKTAPDPRVGEDHDTENDLALSAESPDAVNWTFKLRRDAKFHNIAPVGGHPVEAADVKATFIRAVTEPANPNRSALGMINQAQIQTPANDTVTFRLNYPFASFAKLMASTAYSWVLPREALAGAYDPAKLVIGSGPFIFDHYTPDVELVYRKNPEWFEQGRPYVDSLRAAIIPDVAQDLAQFIAGNLDEWAPGTTNEVDTIKRSAPKAQLITAPIAGGSGLYMQLGDPASPFQDIRLRRAISLALDRETIGKVIYQGEYDLTFTVGPGFGKWALTMADLAPSDRNWYTYDPAQAKKLIAEAGFENAAVRVGYVTGAPQFGSGYATKTEMISNMLNAVGLRTTLAPLDYVKDYIGGSKGVRYGNYPKDMIVHANTALFSDPDEPIYQYFDSKSPISETRVSDSALDGLIDKARTTVDDAARVTAYKDVQRYIAQKMYVVAGLPRERRYMEVQPWVRNYCYFDASGTGTEIYSKVWLQR